MNSINHQISPKRHSFGEAGQQDFYDQMAKMVRQLGSNLQIIIHFKCYWVNVLVLSCTVAGVALNIVKPSPILRVEDHLICSFS